jgi:hypothetical protein
VDSNPDPLFLRKSGSAVNRNRTSGSVARNSDFTPAHYVCNTVCKSTTNMAIMRNSEIASDKSSVHLYSKDFTQIKAGTSYVYSDCLWAGQPRGRSSSPGRVKNCHFTVLSRQALRSTQPSIEWVPSALSLDVKR